MSRATVATSTSTSTPEPWYLVARPNTASLIVSSDDYPNSSVAILPGELRTFRVIWHWLQMCDQGRNPLFRSKRSSSENAPEIPYSIFALILNFTMPNFIDHNYCIKRDFAFFLMSQLLQTVSVRKSIPLSQLVPIPHVLSVQSVDNETISLFNVTASSFFDFKASNLPALLDASLNADLKTVERIFKKTDPDILCRLLSTEDGKATTVLGRITVERTGTPLQMAIYDHDEEMVAFFKAFFKEKMDLTEFQRQCEKVIGTDYDAFLKKQEFEATEICADLEKAFKSAPPDAFNVNYGNSVASTTSTELLGIIDVFINRLAHYCQKNPMHNPYILQRVYEIYYRLPRGPNRTCFFSQKVIGGVQSFLSARWLQHYAQDIYYLAERNEVPRRSFICRISSPRIDIRHLAESCIGSNSFLGTFDVGGECGLGFDYLSKEEGGWFTKIMSNKNSKLAEFFMPRVQSTRGCSIQ